MTRSHCDTGPLSSWPTVTKTLIPAKALPLFDVFSSGSLAHGVSAIDRLAKENPLEFLKLCAAVIQEDIKINFGAGDVAGEVCH